MIIGGSGRLSYHSMPFGIDSIVREMTDANMLGSNASTAWPLANRIYYYPFYVDDVTIVSKLGFLNGNTVSGNFEAGIYDAKTLARLGTTGSTAQAGTSTAQITALTGDVTLNPGCYFAALTLNNTTGTYNRLNHGIVQLADAWGQRQESPGVFGLPATATPGLNSTFYWPFGVILRKGLR